MHDRQQVLGELVLGRLMLVVENHELDALPLEEPLDELESESAESVGVGNGNRAYSPLQRSFQNGFKPPAFEVEPAADVSDDLCARAPVAHVRNLTLEVGLLTGRGHAAVGDGNAVIAGGFDHGSVSMSRLGVHGRGGCTDGVHGRRLGGEVGIDIVEARAAGRAQRGNAPLCVPQPQRCDGDSESSRGNPAFYPDHPS